MSQQWTLTGGRALWQDLQGTIPVTADGQFVGRIDIPGHAPVLAPDLFSRPTAHRDAQGQVYIYGEQELAPVSVRCPDA